ncbi:MAG: tetratricopeptide repeat protein, partial [Eubacterium sp.]|nr:tetratricopeptide repeat protein [Eubacterium sp.]
EANAPTHDVIIMSRNYARLLAETGEAHRAITALQKCADFVKATNSETTTDYADLLFDIAGITSQIDGIQSAEQYFIHAFKIYREVLPDDDLREKAALAVKYFERAGVIKLPNYLALE